MPLSIKAIYLPSHLPDSTGTRTICTNSSKVSSKFSFKGQYEKCPNGMKCGSILNWLGVEAYPTCNSLSISEEDKKDPSKLLDALECYFKPERNIFQSWYSLGSI